MSEEEIGVEDFLEDITEILDWCVEHKKEELFLNLIDAFIRYLDE